jgi:hypothetical protein
MRNDLEGFHDPVEERVPELNGRRKRSTFLISVSVLAAIGGSWSGWQLRNGTALQATAIVGSLYGILPQQKPSELPNDEIQADLANELAKRATGAHLEEQGSTGVVTPDAPEAAHAVLPVAEPAAPIVDPRPQSRPQPLQTASIAAVASRYEALVEPPAATSPPSKIAVPEAVASEPAVQAPPPPAIPADEQQQMMLRADTMLHEGDIAGARTILARLDRVGNGQASFDLAQTYDPVMLNRWNVLGIAPDADKAMQFYKRARDEGIAEAQEHLTASASAQR